MGLEPRGTGQTDKHSDVSTFVCSFGRTQIPPLFSRTSSHLGPLPKSSDGRNNGSSVTISGYGMTLSSVSIHVNVSVYKTLSSHRPSIHSDPFLTILAIGRLYLKSARGVSYDCESIAGPSVRPSIHPSIPTPIRSSVHWCVHPAIISSVHQSVCPSIRVSMHLSFRPPIRPPVFLCVHPFVHLPRLE